jgi:hypothetical protein
MRRVAAAAGAIVTGAFSIAATIAGVVTGRGRSK